MDLSARHPFVDSRAARWLPSSARLVAHPDGPALAALLRERCARASWGIPPERFHTTGRSRQDLQRSLARALAEADAAELLERILVDAAAWLFPGDVDTAAQREPYTRVVPPRDARACKPFHVDAYVGHPRNQRGLWMPIVDVVGPEGLWLVDDAVTEPLLEKRPLAREQMDAMARAARPVPMSAGELLVLSSTTGHGGVPHELNRTRVSFDVRIAPLADAPRGALGWVSRRLAPA